MLLALPAYPQPPATVEGILTDPSGAAVPDATIVLESIAAPADRRETISDTGGRFRFDLPPGRYRLTVTHVSLRRHQQEIALVAGERLELPIRLALEPLSSSVVVTAQAFPIPAVQASEPVSVLTRTEIDRRQTVRLAPLLATLPGIALAQSGNAGGTASLFLDGGTSNFTKVLIDGVTVNEPGGVVDFANLTLDNVDKVELVRGAQSALAGSDAMTGVVEILSHRGSTRTPAVTLESYGGSFSTGRGMAQVSGLVGPFDYSTAGSYFTTDGDGPNNAFLNRSVAGNFGFRLAERNSVRLTVRGHSSKAGVAGQTAFQLPNLDQYNRLSTFVAGLRWEFATGPRWQHRLAGTETYIEQLFSNELSDFFTSPDPFASCDLPRSPEAVPSDYCDFTFTAANQFNRAGFSAQSSYIVSRGAVTLGYDYEVENGFLNALFGGHARRNNQAGYLDARWQLTARLGVNAGFRVEDNDSFGTRAVPRAGAAFLLRESESDNFWGATRLRFAYGQGIKEPRLDQSFGTDICNPGNPDLRPEQSRTVHAGIEQRLAADRISLSADYFENRFEDIVSFTFCFPDGPCPVEPPGNCPFGFGTYFNTDLARARGTHIAVEAELARGFTVSGNYTLNATRVLESPNAFDPALSPGNRLIRQPLHSGNLVFNAALGPLSGNLVAWFVGPRTDSDFLFPPLGLSRNPGFATFDLALTGRLSRQASVLLRVENLFDKQYQYVLGYPALGRGVYVGTRFRLGGE